MLCLAGCGSNQPVVTSIDAEMRTMPEEEVADPIGEYFDDDETLAANFKLVCDQIGIQTEDIEEINHTEGEEDENKYYFVYNDWVWYLNCNEDSTVKSVYIGSEWCVFDQEEGSYKFEDYVPDDEIMVIIEERTLDILSQQLGLAGADEVPVEEWYVNRENNIYHQFGTISQVTSSGEQYSQRFSLMFQYDTEEDKDTLLYFSLGDTEVFNELETAVTPDREPAVEQTPAKAQESAEAAE
jgi:hypothetical protein